MTLRLLLPLLLLSVLAAGCRRPANRPHVDRTTIHADAEGFIPWADAKRLVLSGEVVSVSQTHARVVHVTLKDGTTYKSKEDRLDEVITLIRDNGLEDDISIAVE